MWQESILGCILKSVLEKEKKKKGRKANTKKKIQVEFKLYLFYHVLELYAEYGICCTVWIPMELSKYYIIFIVCFLYIYISLIYKNQNGRQYQHIQAVYILFLTRAILKGLTLRKIVFDVCVCMHCFTFVYRLVLQIWLKKGFTYLRRVLKCAFTPDMNLIVLRWPCVIDRMLNSHYSFDNCLKHGIIRKWGEGGGLWAFSCTYTLWLKQKTKLWHKLHCVCSCCSTSGHICIFFTRPLFCLPETATASF